MSGDEAVRKEFEAYAKKPKLPLKRDGVHYVEYMTQLAWWTWQASRSAAIQECAAVIRMGEKELRKLAPDAAAKFYDTDDDYNSEDLFCDAMLALKER